jgi:hypothetical protein
MTELCELAIKYRTDKVGEFMHHYTPVYDKLFGYRRNEIKKVLEIGIGYDNSSGMAHINNYKGGASLRMWEEYFPNAEIFGADIREDALINEGRIKSFYVDQSIPQSVEELKVKVGNDFDIIIDDGSHRPDHYIMTAGILLPILKQDGIYIIEDVNDSFINRIRNEFHNFNVEIVQLNPEKKMDLVDDNLAIIRYE